MDIVQLRALPPYYREHDIDTKIKSQDYLLFLPIPRAYPRHTQLYCGLPT